MSDDERASSPGKLRPSQLITTYGPGAIFQTENDSVLIMGIHAWWKNDFKPIHHPVLEGTLRVKGFRMPQQVDRKEIIPCKSFPLWGVCTDKFCRRLQKHDPLPEPNADGFRCVEKGCNHAPLIHARFITMCDNGHISDFPWERWAHHKYPEYKNTDAGHCENPKLFFKSTGSDPGISGYFVFCTTCKSKGFVGHALKPSPHSGLLELYDDQSRLKCEGRRPWLDNENEDIEDCDEQPYGVQTRATNVYFPVPVSGILISKWTNDAQREIKLHSETIEDTLASGIEPIYLAKTMNFFDKIKKTNPELWIPEKIAKEIEIWNEARTKKYQRRTEKEVKEEEFHDMESTEEYDDEEFSIKEVKNISNLRPYIEKLKQIKRLTEINVIRGFTRGQAPDPFSIDTKNQNYCELKPKPKNGDEKKWWNWLPGVENRGEGIFLILNQEKLQSFDKNSEVLQRFEPLKNSFNEWVEERKWKMAEEFKPRYILLHTLAHLLIRQLASTSGYNAASIRERIYYSDTTNGIMLYTASSSSDGSLGGLVRQGEAENFENLLQSAIRAARRCSRDPLCMEEDPKTKLLNKTQAITRINGSACYACSLLPETCCENSNRLLDRQFVINEKYGFFRELK